MKVFDIKNYYDYLAEPEIGYYIIIEEKTEKISQFNIDGVKICFIFSKEISTSFILRQLNFLSKFMGKYFFIKEINQNDLENFEKEIFYLKNVKFEMKKNDVLEFGNYKGNLL